MSAKKKQPVFDTIVKVDTIKDNGGSVWRGGKGQYVIRHTEKRTGQHAPVAHVILNNKYLTGLFRTKNKGIYSADIKTDGGKVYLLFVVHGHEDNIEIVQKSTP